MASRDYTKTLTDRKTLTTAISALSLIEFHAKQGISKDIYVQPTTDVKKQVVMLDGLALLLIFRDKSECAATALVQESGPRPQDNLIKILWAKNNSAPGLSQTATISRQSRRKFQASRFTRRHSASSN